MGDFMIKIDNETYTNEKIDVSWGTFSYSYFDNGVRKRRSGNSPYFDISIINNLNEEICVGIETTISDIELKNLNIGKDLDINTYISDLIYSINGICEPIFERNENFICLINKINSDTFNFKFNYKSLNIIIDCNILMNLSDSD